ncbi:MAG: prepilin peptidase [Deltaproteobacteria bacterium]|nr:prepilin peptidase [Deltaproteobacteria bacterium]
MAVGSFLNVLIAGFAEGPGIWRARSACPACGHRLGAWELIPVVSYFLLRGRCHHCGGAISSRYLWVELAGGLLGAASLGLWGVSLLGFTRLWLLAALFTVAVVDARQGQVPDLVTWPTALGGVALAAWLPLESPLTALAQTALAGGGLFLVAWTYETLRGREGLGLGDVKIIAMLGAHLGWTGAAVALFAAAVSGVVFYTGCLVAGRMSYSQRVPFGPFLAAGGALAVFVAPWWPAWPGAWPGP